LEVWRGKRRAGGCGDCGDPRLISRIMTGSPRISAHGVEFACGVAPARLAKTESKRKVPLLSRSFPFRLLSPSPVVFSRGKTEIASPSALLQTGIQDRFAYLWASRQQWHHTLRMSLIAQATPQHGHTGQTTMQTATTTSTVKPLDPCTVSSPVCFVLPCGETQTC
jgi:hypothetical protein